MLLIAWCFLHRHLKTPILIHENVFGFDPEVLVRLLCDLYVLCKLEVHPRHCGFPFLSRPRLYFILVRKGGLQITHDICETYGILASRFSSHRWDWLAIARGTKSDLLAEENRGRKRMGLSALTDPSPNWSYLLTEKQAQYKQTYEEKLNTQTAAHSGLAVFNLGDNPNNRLSWGKSRLPTFKRNAGKYWSDSLGRWLVSSERSLAMGFPVDNVLCTAPQIGNAMHVGNVGMVMATVLACLK